MGCELGVDVREAFEIRLVDVSDDQLVGRRQDRLPSRRKNMRSSLLLCALWGEEKGEVGGGSATDPGSPLSAGRAGASGGPAGRALEGFAAGGSPGGGAGQRSLTRSLAAEPANARSRNRKPGRRAGTRPRQEPGLLGSATSAPPPSEPGTERPPLRAPGQSASWQAGKSGESHSRPDLRGWGPVARSGLCSPRVCKVCYACLPARRF